MSSPIARCPIAFLTLLAGLFILSPSAVAQTPVTIPDQALDGLVRWALEKSPADVILDTDMAALTELVDIFPGGERIRSLEGLQYAVNLTHLGLGRNEIADLGPLAGLTHLQRLTLFGNRVSDLTPLANLTALEHLEMPYNRIVDIAPLGNLTALTHLSIYENSVQDLEALRGLDSLVLLGIRNNRVSDLGPLEGLVQLEVVYAGYNEIVDLAPLLKNAQDGVLDRVYVGHNLLDAMAVCDTVPELAALGVDVRFELDLDYPRPDLNVVCQDPMGDRDQDGLSNLDEVNFSTGIDVPDSDSGGAEPGEGVGEWGEEILGYG